MKPYVTVTFERNNNITSSRHSLTWFEEDGNMPTLEGVLASMIEDHVDVEGLLKELGYK